MMINQHGLAVCVRAEDVSTAVKRGLRAVENHDVAHLESDRSTFALPWVTGWEPGCLGETPVVVCGAGESGNQRLIGALHLAVNPRPHAAPAWGVIGLDELYWQEQCWAWPGLAEAHCFHPRNVRGPDKTLGTFRSRATFGMPLRALRADPASRIEVVVGKAQRNAHFSAIAGVLLARYLSRGPTILTGIELSGTDTCGEAYRRRQLPAWRAVTAVLDRLFVHPAMAGPLSEYLPRWNL